MTAKIQIRRDTTANWSSGNPALAAGEIGYDTTLGQVKVGDGSTAWNTLGWLNGTLPVYSSPTSQDLNNAANQLPGIYRFSTVTGMSNVPAAPIDIKAADGGITMLVVKVGSILVQQLWTDADGSQPAKTYSRVYDGAWKSWTAQNAWAMDATEGVDVIAKSIDLKGTATIAGIASFAAGAVGAPAIARTGDLDTGIYFPATNELAIATGGVAAISVDSSQKTTLGGNLEVFGNLNMTTGTISNVVNPSNAQDAATKNYLEINRIGAIAVVMTTGSAITQVIGSTQQNGSIGSTSATTFTLIAGTTGGNVTSSRLRAPTGQTWHGIGINSGASGRVPFISVTDNATTLILGTDVVAGTEQAYVLVRTA